MKLFKQGELLKAYEHAAMGGQALHIISGRFAYLRKDTPSCFKGRTELAHLFDQNIERLVKVAKSLGVRVIKVERVGDRGQHIDLCGKPLERARQLCVPVETLGAQLDLVKGYESTAVIIDEPKIHQELCDYLRGTSLPLHEAMKQLDVEGDPGVVLEEISDRIVRNPDGIWRAATNNE